MITQTHGFSVSFNLSAPRNPTRRDAHGPQPDDDLRFNLLPAIVRGLTALVSSSAAAPFKHAATRARETTVMKSSSACPPFARGFHSSHRRNLAIASPHIGFIHWNLMNQYCSASRALPAGNWASLLTHKIAAGDACSTVATCCFRSNIYRFCTWSCCISIALHTTEKQQPLVVLVAAGAAAQSGIQVRHGEGAVCFCGVPVAQWSLGGTSPASRRWRPGG